MINGNGVDHALVSEASREMARPPHEKMRFNSYIEENRFLAEKKIFVQGKLSELNGRLAQRKNSFFQEVGGSRLSTGHQWKRIEAEEFLPERKSLVAELTSIEARLAKIRAQAKKEQAIEADKLYRADGSINHDRAFLEILGSLAKLTRAVEGLSRRLDAIESRGLMEASQ